MSEPPADSRWDAAGPPGSTPLGPDELDQLIPTWVATRADLNEVEQQNILDALTLPRWRSPTVSSLLDDQSVRRLHKDMFGKVWRWAGSYRSREVNIGAAPYQVAAAVRDLVKDADVWIHGDRPMSSDEVGYRFHHRLVAIHPFPNGNGRHARAMTDLLLRALDQPVFTWGSGSLDVEGAVRSAYIEALRAADAGDFEPFAAFVRS